MQQIAGNLWVRRYPLTLLGIQIGRTVTIIRLASDKLVIHSTAPFTEQDVAEIRALGEPAWLLDVTRFHDSEAKRGRAAFPEITYLVPEGFPHARALRASSLDAIPAEWSRELETLRIGGMPNAQEHTFFHVASRTLIVADLLFNFGPSASAWTRFFARHLMRLPHGMGMSLAFRFMIRDRVAFCASMRRIFAWDFDRVIVGHGEIVETGGKNKLRAVLQRFGLVSASV